MRILVLGGYGMAGHLAAVYLRKTMGHEVTVAVRPGSAARPASRKRELPPDIPVRELDARDLRAAEELIEREKPEVLVNAVGVLNSQAEDRPLDAYVVNGLLPHWLAYVGERLGARLVHISSDCVFSGDRGGYGETERPDGRTVYARSKAMGEVEDPRHLTIRTSIIGPEIRDGGIGLMKWFLSQTGTVKGYSKVPWNGVTTLELAKAIAWAIDHPEIGGLAHLTAPRPISKHELLTLIRSVYDKNDVTIEPSDEPAIDRTLLPTTGGFGYRPPDYPTMLRELREWERSSWD